MVAGLPSDDDSGTCVSNSVLDEVKDERSGLSNKQSFYPNSDVKYQYRTKVLTMLEQKNKYYEDFRQYSPADRGSQTKKHTVLGLAEQRAQSSSCPSSSRSRQHSPSPNFFCGEQFLPFSPTVSEWSCKSPALMTQEPFDFGFDTRMKMLRSTSSRNPMDDNDVGRYRLDALKLIDFTYMPSAQTRHEVNLMVEFPFHLNFDQTLAKRIRFDGNSRSKELGYAQISHLTQCEHRQKFVEVKEDLKKSKNKYQRIQLSSTTQGYLENGTNGKESTWQAKIPLPSWFQVRNTSLNRDYLQVTNQQCRGRSLTRIARPRSYSSASTRSIRRKDSYPSSNPISEIPTFQEIILLSTPTKSDTKKHQRLGSASRHARNLNQSRSRTLNTSPRVSSKARASLIPPPSFKYGSPSSISSSDGRKVSTIPKPFNLSRGRTLSRESPNFPVVKSCPPSSNRYSGRKKVPTVPKPFNLSAGPLHRHPIRTPEKRLSWSASPKSFKARPLPEFYNSSLPRSDSPVMRNKDRNENLDISLIVKSLKSSFENLNETAKKGEENINKRMDTVNRDVNSIHSRFDELVQITNDQLALTQSRKESNHYMVDAKINEMNNHIGTLQNGISRVKDLLEAQENQRKMEMMILCSNCGSFIYYNRLGYKKYSCDLVKIVLQWFALGHGCNIRADYTTTDIHSKNLGENGVNDAGRKDFHAKFIMQIKDIIGHKPRIVKKEDGSHDIFFS